MEQLKAQQEATELRRAMEGMTEAQQACVCRVLYLLTSTSGSVYNQVCAYMEEVGRGGMAFADIVARLDELEQAAAAAMA